MRSPEDYSQVQEAPTALSRALWCGFYALGLILMLVVYGLLQERIMTIPYGIGANEEVFSYSVFLVFCNRAAAVVFAVIMAGAKKETFRNQAPLWKCLVVSLSNVFASTCQYESLKYVSFAVQTLGKSFKMMPVMVWGMCISGKQYGLRDWLIAAAVTLGVTQFLTTGPTEAPNDNASSIKGLAWLAAFLSLDGLTAAMQEKLFREHKTTKYNQMMYVNFASCCVSVISLTASRTFGPALAFCFEHDRFFVDAATLSASAVAGQFFIYSQVKEFGALVFAATMNIRQIASILFSYITYHHSITSSQVCGCLLVFFALFYKCYISWVDTSESQETLPLLKKESHTDEEKATGSSEPATFLPKQVARPVDQIGLRLKD